jgi:hypothetical protein
VAPQCAVASSLNHPVQGPTHGLCKGRATDFSSSSASCKALPRPGHTQYTHSSKAQNSRKAGAAERGYAARHDGLAGCDAAHVHGVAAGAQSVRPSCAHTHKTGGASRISLLDGDGEEKYACGEQSPQLR